MQIRSRYRASFNTLRDIPKDLRGTERSPLIVRTVPAPKTEGEIAQEAKDREDKAANEQLSIRFNRLLVLLNAILAASTIALWWVTRRSANAAIKSAEVAENTVGTMRDTAERQLRAYVHIKSVQISDINAPGPMKIQVEIKNWGQTPAYDFTWMVKGTLADYPTFELPEADPHEEKLGGAGDFAPGASLNTQIVGRRFTAEEKNGLTNGVKALFLYGMARYTDAFKKPRITKFRYMIGGDLGITAGEMYAAPQGNEAN